MKNRHPILAAALWAPAVASLLVGQVVRAEPPSTDVGSGIADINDITGGAGLKEAKLKLANTMNFDSCLQFKVSPCMLKCHGVPLPGIRFKYQEPTALVEVSCRHGATELGKGNLNVLSSALSSFKSPTEQSCIEGIKTSKGTYKQWYFDVHVWGVSALARYQSSGSAGDVTKSLTCQIFGGLSMVASLASMDFASMVNPANWGTALSNMMTNIQSSLSNMVTQLTNLPGTIGSALASLPTNIANSIQGGITSLTNGIQSFGTNLANLATGNFSLTSISDLTTMGGTLTTLGAGLQIAGAVSGNTKLQQAAGMMYMTGIATTTAAGMAQMANVAGSVADGMFGGTGGWETTVTDGNGVSTAWDATVQPESLSGMGNFLANSMGDTMTQLAAAAQQGAQSDQVGGFMAKADVGDIEPAAGPRNGSGLGYMPQQASSVPWNQVSGMTAGGARINNGGAQVMAGNSLERIKLWKEALRFAKVNAVNVASKLVAKPVNEVDAAEACTAANTLKNIEESQSSMVAKFQQPGYNMGLFPRATYLPAGLVQEVLPRTGATSCPLTHCGYTPILSGVAGNERVVGKSYMNARKVCQNNICTMEPLPGFAGNCELNLLSNYQIDSMYPACNGYQPGGSYNANKDHLYKLNMAYTNSFRANLEAALTQIRNARKQVDDRIQSMGGKCDSYGNPQGKWGKPRQTSAKMGDIEPAAGDDLMYQGMSESAPTDLMQGEFGFSEDLTNAITSGKELTPAQAQEFDSHMKDMLDGKTADGDSAAGGGGGMDMLSSAMGWMSTMEALIQQGGVKQLVTGYVNSYIPVGVWLAFASEHTDWMQPPMGPMTAIMTASNMLFANPTNSLAYAGICAAPAYAQAAGVNILGNFNAQFCVGTWGMKHPSTGYDKQEYQPVAAALVGYRGYDRAISLNRGSLKPNTKGTQQFNLDYPYDDSAFGQALGVSKAGGGKHKGSGCYDVGTPHPGWYTSNLVSMLSPEKAIKDIVPDPTAVANVSKGYYSFTYWKKTSCCVGVCSGGLKVKQEY